MLTTSQLPFLPAGRALRRHRAATQHELAAEPAAHLLPALLTLPLGVDPLPDPAAVLAAPRSLALAGPPACGRSLALLQLAHRWAASSLGAALLYLPLAEADALNLTPRAVVAGALHRAGLPETIAEGARPAILLVDDWELLSADRRAVWRAYLAGAAWPAMRAVVALPEGEAWPELDALAFPAPDEARAAAWLAHLLPAHDPAPLLAALRREPRTLTGLADVALLALVYPLAGAPASRAELYEQAYALARPLLAEAPRVGRAVLRHHRLARGFAGGADLAALAALAPFERAAVAPLAAGLLDDPAPVLEPLWRGGAPDLADLRALAACARERPGRAPLWSLRLLERLAAPEAPADEQALLAALAPALPALLSAAGHADEPRALATLAALAAALPDARRPWLAVVDDLGGPEALRWAAADLLAARPPAPQELAEPPRIADGVTLAARFYVAALCRDSHHLLATPALRAGMEALLAARGAGPRRAAAARAIVGDPALPEELRALALAAAGDRELLERSAAAGSAGLRHAALDAIGQGPPEEALAAIGRALASPEADGEARRAALDAAARLALSTATGALARAAVDAAQPFAVRLHAVDLLAGRGPAGAALLRRLMAAQALPDALRAAAAGHLGRLGVAAALPELRNALEAGPLPLRLAAAGALGALGARGEAREESAAALVTGLRRVGPHTVLGERIARALGHTGAAVAVPALGALLGPGLEPSLRAVWLRRIPALATGPASAWPQLDLADDARLALMDALADGGTMADPPTSIAELAARQAARIAAAAAGALGDLAVVRPDLRAAALAPLRAALADPNRTEVVRAALAGLAAAGDPAAELAAILDDPAAPAPLRWLALEGLGRAEPARALLLRRLELGGDDAFLRGAAMRLLGEHRVAAALPALRRAARGDEPAPQLRRAAVVALGRIGGPEAAAALAALAADQAAPADLRAAAANALPPDLPAEALATLHHAARAARQHSELSVALARAMARAGDYEALPALVRSAQGDHGAEAVASIEAIGALGDPSIAPLLVQISQSPTAGPGVRLAAVAALLRLGGHEHLTLLREYLAAAAPPLRMQAYSALEALSPDDPRLCEPIVDGGAPMALRLQALRHLAARDPNNPVLAMALAQEDEDPQVRLAAASALAAASSPSAASALAAVVAAPAPPRRPAPPVLRRRCAAALGALARGGPAAAAARDLLATIAADPAQPAEHRCWAAEELLSC
jgi:HEAT repeat protein